MIQKWQLKKYVPVYSLGNSLFVGYPDNQEKKITLEYTGENLDQIERCIKSGITEAELTDPIYKTLNDAGLLEIIPDLPQTSRNELFLDYFSGIAIDENVQKSRILVFGAGAGGSTLVYLLAQFGFNNIIVIDFDKVEKTDIFRVMVYEKEHIGELKVEALKKRIYNNFNIEIQVNTQNFFTYDELEEIITYYAPDIVVKACDPELGFRVNLNKVCFEHSISYITMAYSFENLKIGPFYVPGFTACDQDFDRMVHRGHMEQYGFSDYKLHFRENHIHPSVTFNINTLASIILKEIVFFLYKKYEYCISIGRLVSFNAIILQYRYWDVVHHDDCPVCSKLRE